MIFDIWHLTFNHWTNGPNMVANSDSDNSFIKPACSCPPPPCWLRQNQQIGGSQHCSLKHPSLQHLLSLLAKISTSLSRFTFVTQSKRDKSFCCYMHWDHETACKHYKTQSHPSKRRISAQRSPPKEDKKISAEITPPRRDTVSAIACVHACNLDFIKVMVSEVKEAPLILKAYHLGFEEMIDLISR